jgi:hypothetical protein
MSFKETNSFSMLAGNVTELQENILKDTNNEKIGVLKSAVFYGANASGKSNLFEAIGYYKTFILSSQKLQSGEGTGRKHFRLDATCNDRPTKLEMLFLTKNKNMYKYGFALDNMKVQSEWLELVQKNGDVKTLLTRDVAENKLEIASEMVDKKVTPAIIDMMLNGNVLLLSFLGTLKGDIAAEIIAYFTHLLILDNTDEIRMTKTERLAIGNDAKYKQQLLHLLKSADLGIEDISVDERDVKSQFSVARVRNEKQEEELAWDDLPNRLKERLEERATMLLTRRKSYEDGKETGQFIETPYEVFESKGTIKLMTLAYKLIHAINNGTTIIIDELDTELHPLLMRAITKMFNNQANKECGQLLFTSHDVSLIDTHYRLMRRDQVWFTDKSSKHESTLYSLYDFKYEHKNGDYKTIRKDENYATNYLKGKYRGVPIVRDLFEVDWGEAEDE